MLGRRKKFFETIRVYVDKNFLKSDNARRSFSFVCKENKVEIISIILVLLFIIFSLIVFAVMQIQMAGIEVKDFWSFINANQELDKLYAFSKKYEKMSPQEQIIFLKAAEKMADAFDKVPSMIWEDEYDKYRDVMDIYRSIKIKRWNEQ